jgi:hypothetical protein
MGKPSGFNRDETSRSASIPLAGRASVIMLLFEVSVPLLYFGLIALVGGFGPVLKVPILLVVWVGCVIVATLYFVAFTGTLLCVLGLASRRSFFKWLLISLSLLGVLPLPIGIFYRVEAMGKLAMLCALGGWSMLIFVTTLIAFSYIEAMPLKQRRPEDWSES